MDLSVLIPARNEIFLKQTVEDILQNSEMDTEVIVGLDEDWANPGLEQNDRVNIVRVGKAVGQRAITNLACKLSTAKYVMKVDAHCAFDKGFDRKMIEAYKKTGDDVTMVPVMRNLHCFDWKCYHCGEKWYQDVDVKTCDQCGKADKIRRKMIWKPRRGTHNQSYGFEWKNDKPYPSFFYFGDYKHRPEYERDRKEKGVTETMSLQGSCFMCTRENYWKWNLSDEQMGNWGNQGIEVACKTWMSGGRVLCCHDTWYAHMFRTKPIFNFPWPVSGRDQDKTKLNVWDYLVKENWEGKVHPVSWVVEKFMPVPSWDEEKIKQLKENEV